MKSKKSVLKTDSELKAVDSKEGKISKKSKKNEKIKNNDKVKTVVHDEELVNLVSAAEEARVKNVSKKKKKNKNKQKNLDEAPKSAPQNGKEIKGQPSEDTAQVKSEKPKKKNKDTKTDTKVETNGKERDEKTLAKIEKKKAKKLAQKLKKKLKKSLPNTTVVEKKENAMEISQNDSKESPKKAKKNKKSNTDKDGGVKAMESPKKPNPYEKILGDKKKRKAEKRAQIKKEFAENGKEAKQRDHEEDAATVFVGNLPTNTKRVQLVRVFEDYKPVIAIRFRTAGGKVIFKHKNRTAAGTLNAYVRLDSKEKAEQALSLNGVEFKGNHLRITRADANSHHRGGTGDFDTKSTIFVGNLKYSATEENLREIFSSCGEIDYIRCLRDGEKGCKGVAYVCFKSPDAVGLALELKDTIYLERPMHIERYSVKKLGAKESRDAAAANAPKMTGAKKRLNEKNPKGNKKENTKSFKGDHENGNKKKGEFRGVKVDAMKQKKKKKKVTSQMQQLAKKIAPSST